MIKLVPSNESKEVLTNSVSNRTIFTNDLYSCIYSLNESFYKNLLLLTEESKFTKIRKYFSKALDLLIPESSKFMKISMKINHLNAYHARTIYRYTKKNDIFANSVFLVKDIKTNYLSLPSTKSFVNEKNKRVWFLTYRTPEDMMKYIDDNTKIRFKEGFYKPARIVAIIKVFSDEAMDNLLKAKKDIEEKKVYLDKNKSIDENHKELLYMQLTVYYRAILYLYGMQLTDITNTIDDIFDHIDDDDIKKHTFDDDYEYVKNFMNNLI